MLTTRGNRCQTMALEAPPWFQTSRPPAACNATLPFGAPTAVAGLAADGDFATVSTRIVTKNGTEVPVDYRMIKRADRWLVYDVSIEGVSLVSNYRTQFNKIIQTTSYNELVSKLRNKQDELLAEDKGGKKKP